MLVQLAIRDIVLIDRLDLDFGAGLTGIVLEKGDEGAILWRFEADSTLETVMAAAGAMPPSGKRTMRAFTCGSVSAARRVWAISVTDRL